MHHTKTLNTRLIRARYILELDRMMGQSKSQWADELRGNIPASSFPGVLRGSGLRRRNQTIGSINKDSKGRLVFLYSRSRQFNKNVAEARKLIEQYSV